MLAPYFEPWANRLEHSAVGAFLSLLGDGKDEARILRLAEHWLGTDISVAQVRRELAGADEVRCANVSSLRLQERGRNTGRGGQHPGSRW